MESPTAELLSMVVNLVKRYVVLASSSQAIAIALWVLHTYAFGAADSTPYLLVTSPEKRSGKSRLLEVLDLLARKSWYVSGISEAVLYRKIQKECPSLLLDELDAIFGTYLEKTEPIRGLINSGSRRGGTYARCVGPSHEVTDFSTYCPKCLAGIATGRLPETIRDRSIPIELQRRRDEPVERFRFKKAREEAEPLVLALGAWAIEYTQPLRLIEPGLPDVLSDRAAEGWEPLLAIAEIAGGDWPEKARKAAAALCGEADVDDDSFGVQLLVDIREIWDPDELGSALASNEICDRLRGLEHAPWRTWGKGRESAGLSPRDLARMLRRYRVKPRTVRLSPELTKKGYRYEDLLDPWSRYCPTDPSSETE